MALKTKTDYFGLATTGLVTQEDAENQTISVVEARGEDGFVVAGETYGQRKQPSNTYVVTANLTLANVKLGGLTADGTSNKSVLTSFQVSTTAGGAPTVTASGTSVPTAAVLTGGCEVTLASLSISALHHAQLMRGITISGTGAHLTQSTYAAEAELSTAEVDGVICAFDITGAKETFSGTIQVSDAAYAAPTVTLPSGWYLTQPLTLTNPNGDFPSWTFAAAHPLADDAV